MGLPVLFLASICSNGPSLVLRRPRRGRFDRRGYDWAKMESQSCRIPSALFRGVWTESFVASDAYRRLASRRPQIMNS